MPFQSSNQENSNMQSDVGCSMHRKTLVLGIGSPIISDDAVGLRVANEIASMDIEGVEVQEHSTSGLDLIEIMFDYDRAIIVDSIVTGEREPGSTMVLRPEDFAEAVEITGPHEVNMATAIEWGNRLEPGRMPKEIYFVAVEVVDVQTLSEEITPRVQEALPDIVDTVVGLINSD